MTLDLGANDEARGVAADFRVVALLSAFNEQDIIGPVVGHLIAQGVDVYLIDDGSTDDTVAEASRFLDSGLIGVESRSPASADGAFDWEGVLKRKEELASTIPADWFIHHDADEFRESPWSDLSLREAIQRVDGLSFNAIDFHLLNFVCTGKPLRQGDDPRLAFSFYQRPESWNRVQIKAWKQQVDRVDLASRGGHDVTFPGRKVFPVRFLLRHYPIRSEEHGQRKVFRERVNRFRAEERARGWHVQYDAYRPGDRFCRPEPGNHHRFDPVGMNVELAVQNRLVEELEARIAQVAQEKALLVLEAQTAGERVTVLTAALADQEKAIHSTRAEATAARLRHQSQLDAVQAQLDDIRIRLAQATDDAAALRSSRTWRWSAPIRAVLASFMRR